MNTESKVSFSSLSQREKISRFTKLLQTQAHCLVWEKGKERRFQFVVYSVDKKSEQILLKNIDNLTINEGEYCLSFFINGVSYFSKCLVKKHGVLSMYCLGNEAILYKTEKRSSFRLLAYPTYKIRAFVKLETTEFAENNIIDFKTKLSRTGLFKNFLKGLDNVVEKRREDGFYHFRVQDISATGMAIIVGRTEGELFTKGNILKSIIVDFEDEEIIIPEGEIIYKVDSIQLDRNNISVYKVGVRFLYMDLQTDQYLVRKINKVLSRMDGGLEFEDFIS